MLRNPAEAYYHLSQLITVKILIDESRVVITLVPHGVTVMSFDIKIILIQTGKYPPYNTNKEAGTLNISPLTANKVTRYTGQLQHSKKTITRKGLKEKGENPKQVTSQTIETK